MSGRTFAGLWFGWYVHHWADAHRSPVAHRSLASIYLPGGLNLTSSFHGVFGFLDLAAALVDHGQLSE